MRVTYFPRLSNAGVAQLVEHLVANENVESSNLFARSILPAKKPRFC